MERILDNASAGGISSSFSPCGLIVDDASSRRRCFHSLVSRVDWSATCSHGFLDSVPMLAFARTGMKMGFLVCSVGDRKALTLPERVLLGPTPSD